MNLKKPFDFCGEQQKIGPFGRDYFDELLERIVKSGQLNAEPIGKLRIYLSNVAVIMIRSVKWQRVLCFVQNKFHFAVTGETV